MNTCYKKEDKQLIFKIDEEIDEYFMKESKKDN